MNNRRQFIKRTISALVGLVAFGRPALRGAAKEMPVILSRDMPDIGRAVVDGLVAGMCSESDVKARIKQVQKDNLVALIDETVASLDNDQGAEACMDKFNDELAELERIAHSLDDGECVAFRIEEFGKACAAQHPELVETRADLSYPVRQTMDCILAANPKTTNEQAFLKAVMEIAEGSL